MKRSSFVFRCLVCAPLLALAGAPLQAGKLGGSVTVLGVWGGQELETFNQLVKPFEEQTGVKVEFTGTRDLDAVLTTRVSAGNPPDLAVLPNPAKMAELAGQGKLVDLGTVLDMKDMKASYAQDWITLGSSNGKFVGIFVKTALKGLVWYNPKSMKQAGVQVPDSFDKLMKASQTLSARGTTPWAIGIESGPASGWVGTDWLENIFLRMYGPKKYTEWYQGKLAWTSPEMREAWKTWGMIVGDKKMTFGGNQYVVSTNFDHAFAPVFQAPPKAYFHFQAAFIQGFIQKQFPNLKAGEDYSFFGFPAIKPEYAKSVEIAGDLFGMFKRTPQSEAFIRYMASAPAQAFWAKSASGISANRKVALSAYPDTISRKAAEVLTSADIAVFDASDMMPSQMNSAFWSAVVSFVSNPDDIDDILAELETVRKDAYRN